MPINDITFEEGRPEAVMWVNLNQFDADTLVINSLHVDKWKEMDDEVMIQTLAMAIQHEELHSTFKSAEFTIEWSELTPTDFPSLLALIVKLDGENREELAHNDQIMLETALQNKLDAWLIQYFISVPYIPIWAQWAVNTMFGGFPFALIVKLEKQEGDEKQDGFRKNF